MSNKFKAIVLNQSGEKFSREIKTLDKSFFKDGDVLVKIDYSDLNFKDSMILKNVGKLMGERLEKKLREKRKREKREKRERDGLYFKIFNIFSNSFFSVILHFFEGYKI